MNDRLSRRFGMSGRRRLSVLVAAVAVVLLGPTAAQAGTWSHTDPTGDVHEFDDAASTPVPDRTIGDVVRTDVALSRGHLVLRVTLSQPLPATNWSVVSEIRTRTTRFDLSLYRYSGYRGLDLENARGKELRCSGLSRTIKGKVLRLVVPRSCIGNPSLVRFGLGVATGDDDTSYGDDALRDTVRDGLALSPRIYRG